MALAGVLSGHVLDQTGALAPMDVSSLRTEWQSLRVKYPREFLYETPRLKIPAREPTTAAGLVDLSPHYNAQLEEASRPVGGEDGPAGLLQGMQNFNGVKFDVRGIIQLAGTELMTWGTRPFPEVVRGIKIQRPCARLHLLHSTTGFVPPGTVIAHVLLNYSEGEVYRIPIVAGEDVGDWATLKPEKPRRAQIAWTGTLRNTRTWTRSVSWYQSAWDNPFPDKTIASVDVVSTLSAAGPYVVALTLE
jgi:hypothetical protein